MPYFLCHFWLSFQIEDALIRHGSSSSLPYWDWTKPIDALPELFTSETYYDAWRDEVGHIDVQSISKIYMQIQLLQNSTCSYMHTYLSPFQPDENYGIYKGSPLLSVLGFSGYSPPTCKRLKNFLAKSLLLANIPLCKYHSSKSEQNS